MLAFLYLLRFGIQILLLQAILFEQLDLVCLDTVAQVFSLQKRDQQACHFRHPGERNTDPPAYCSYLRPGGTNKDRQLFQFGFSRLPRWRWRWRWRRRHDLRLRWGHDCL